MIWGRKKRSYPQWYREYIDLYQEEGWSKDMLALDMETTGINPKTADILSFGSIPILDGEISVGQEVHLFFNGGGQTSDNVIIHELFSHTVEDLFLDHLPTVLREIGNKVLLGHFVAFDIALIDHSLRKLGLPKLRNPRVDTLTMALKKDAVIDLQFADREAYTLYALCERYGVEVEHTHDALQDAYLTCLLYLMIR